MPQKSIAPDALASANGGGDFVAGQQQLPNSTVTPAPSSWRSWIKVHPAADIFPMMSDEELVELGDSIMSGDELVVPLVLGDRGAGVRLPSPRAASYRAAVIKHVKAGNLYLLDGRNRLEAIERWHRDHADDLDDDGHPVVEGAITVKTALGEAKLDSIDGAAERIANLNLRRRHLDREQKRELITKLLKASPERSDRAIAAVAKVSHPTVATVRRELEEKGDVEKFTTRTDVTGRPQPARKPESKEAQIRALRERGEGSAPPRTGATEPPPRPPTASAMAAFARDIEKTLREWRLRRAEIDAMPLPGRVAHARALLRVLDVNISDLAPIGATP